jgi:hypothetical protein
MSPGADWLAELRRLHDDSFRGTDWQAAMRELNVELATTPTTDMQMYLSPA